MDAIPCRNGALSDSANTSTPGVPASQGSSALQPLARPRASAVRFKTALRRAIRKNTREPGVDFLNLTAMLDMMTILLVFLLKNASASNAAAAQSDDFRLPPSIVSNPLKEEGIALFITRSQILVGNNPEPAVALPYCGRLGCCSLGSPFDPDDSGPYLKPLGDALRVAREQDRQIKAARGNPDAKSEAIILADKDTPYRLLTQVIYTLGQSEFGKFRLMVLSGAAPSRLARPGPLSLAPLSPPLACPLAPGPWLRPAPPLARRPWRCCPGDSSQLLAQRMLSDPHERRQLSPAIRSQALAASTRSSVGSGPLRIERTLPRPQARVRLLPCAGLCGPAHPVARRGAPRATRRPGLLKRRLRGRRASPDSSHSRAVQRPRGW